jgi:Holliday junction resolvase
MTETHLTRGIRRFLQAEGFKVIKIHGGRYQEAGLPDLLAIRDGIAWWFEVKRPGRESKTTPLQKLQINELRECGCPVFVVTSVEETRKEVERCKPC